MFIGKQNPELEEFAKLLEKSVVELFMERGEIKFSRDVAKKRKTIVEYNGRMRADGMEKFRNEPTYVSVVNYYAGPADLAKKKTLGTLIVYVQQDYLATMMKQLKYPPIDDESENAMLDSCGTLCNIVAGRFKSEISNAGYVELEMSHFEAYRNSAFNGVAFCFNEFDMYETTFDMDGKKRLVIDLSIGVVPRR